MTSSCRIGSRLKPQVAYKTCLEAIICHETGILVSPRTWLYFQVYTSDCVNLCMIMQCYLEKLQYSLIPIRVLDTNEGIYIITNLANIIISHLWLKAIHISFI